mmetsp:Transcript_18316/g.73226  ORF Transcript_18316/g.73226 Transcript_18316/m.73226 type:complete len:204 (+) Transcript_18316:1084-1695(+)
MKARAPLTPPSRGHTDGAAGRSRRPELGRRVSSTTRDAPPHIRQSRARREVDDVGLDAAVEVVLGGLGVVDEAARAAEADGEDAVLGVGVEVAVVEEPGAHGVGARAREAHRAAAAVSKQSAARRVAARPRAVALGAALRVGVALEPHAEPRVPPDRAGEEREHRERRVLDDGAVPVELDGLREPHAPRARVDRDRRRRARRL